MGEQITLAKKTRASMMLENFFYGHDIRIEVPNDTGNLQIEIRPYSAQFSTRLGIRIHNEPCEIFLENLPALEQISSKFHGIDFFSLPNELQLPVLQDACNALVGYFSQHLGSTIVLEQVETLATYDEKGGIDFVLSADGKYLTSGRCVVPQSILVMFSRKLVAVPRLRHFDAVEIPYHFWLGKTSLSPSEYQDLGEGDIIFFDEHDLANEKKVGIVGIGEKKIRGRITSDGVQVCQIE